MSRPVHYRAAGNGLSFPCYWREMDAHLGAMKRHEAVRPTTGTDWIEVRRAIRKAVSAEAPPPRQHTSLDRVTCAECWKSILRMAVARGASR